ncbi:MAG TPA: hypothetical protein VE978_13470 [Chitinophagales bacterium]|nr:hypothetical protein [Chitinophagales bacterium]
MLPEIKFLPVNWMDGMKVSDRHFIQQELSIADRLRDYAAMGITSFNFGLLPPAPGVRSSFDLQFNVDQSKFIRVKLNECRAITPAGARIEISSTHSKEVQVYQSELEATFKIKSATTSQLDVVIIVNPFSRVPAGSPDPEETPARYPYTLPECRLEIIPSEQVNQSEAAAFNITIGKINVVGEEITLDESFIPPCAFICSYKPLQDEFEAMRRQLFDIGTAAMMITQKIKSEPKKTELANNILYLSEKVLSYLSIVIPQLRLTIEEAPPVMMFEKLSSLGYSISAAVNSMPDRDKEKMFNYFKQWIEMSQSQFENAMMSVMSIEYNHLNIAKSLQASSRFVSVVARLFKQLSKLKYIGEQKDSGIVIGETIEPLRKAVGDSSETIRPAGPQQPDTKPPSKGWSFLND